MFLICLYFNCYFHHFLNGRPSSVGLSVGRSVCHYFLKGREVSLPCSNRSSCLLLLLVLFLFLILMLLLCFCGSWLSCYFSCNYLDIAVLIGCCMMLPSLLLVYWYCWCFQNDEVVDCVCCRGGDGPEEAAHQGGDQAAQCQERHPCQVLMDCFIIKNKVKVSYPSIKISLSGINYLYHDQDRFPCLALQPFRSLPVSA